METQKSKATVIHILCGVSIMKIIAIPVKNMRAKTMIQAIIISARVFSILIPFSTCLAIIYNSVRPINSPMSSGIDVLNISVCISDFSLI